METMLYYSQTATEFYHSIVYSGNKITNSMIFLIGAKSFVKLLSLRARLINFTLSDTGRFYSGLHQTKKFP